MQKIKPIDSPIGEPHTLQLKEDNIKFIALIDDAFDTPEITDDQISEFLTSLNNRRDKGSGAKKAEFDDYCNSTFNKILNDPMEFDKDVLSAIWKNRHNFNVLKDDLRVLFSIGESKFAQVARITQKIEGITTSHGGIELKVREFGSDISSNISELKDVEVVLIDFRMGPEETEEERKQSRRKAIDIVKKIDSELKPELPLVILMSSDPDVGKYANEFQKDSKWIKGLFYCIPKKDLDDEIRLKINFSSWSERLKGGTAINEFTQSIEQSLKKSLDTIKEKINQLSLEDYAFINHYSLQADGQALGEYIIWLLGAYTKREIFEANTDVEAKRKNVDEIKFEAIPLKKLMPTSALIEMYDSALFDRNTGKLETVTILAKKTIYSQGVASGNKIKKVSNASNQTTNIKFVKLKPGYIFIKDTENPVLMVINADCDLVVTENGCRMPAPTIAFIKGQLSKINGSKIPSNDYDTDFFKYKKTAYHISWDVKSIVFCEASKVQNYLEKNGYKLEGRLRVPFISKVQQAYANQFSRIGLPVAPPLNFNVKAEVNYVDSAGKIIKIGETESEVAFFTKTRSEKDSQRVFQCHFTDEFYYFLWESLNSSKIKYEEEISTLGNRISENSSDASLTNRLNKKVALVNDKKGKLIQLIDNFFEWATKKKIQSFVENKGNSGYNFLDADGYIKLYWEDNAMPQQGYEGDIIFVNFV